MSPSNDKRALNQAFGDEMTRGLELVLTPLLFGGLGYLVDRVAGTSPWFTVAFGTFALVGMVVKMWFGYDAEMRAMESAGRWARRTQGNDAPDAPEVRDLWATRKAQDA